VPVSCRRNRKARRFGVAFGIIGGSVFQVDKSYNAQRQQAALPHAVTPPVPPPRAQHTMTTAPYSPPPAHNALPLSRPPPPHTHLEALDSTHDIVFAHGICQAAAPLYDSCADGPQLQQPTIMRAAGPAGLQHLHGSTHTQTQHTGWSLAASITTISAVRPCIHMLVGSCWCQRATCSRGIAPLLQHHQLLPTKYIPTWGAKGMRDW
jgi:hypothetical protein